jgi:hypothetical protein
MAKTYSIKNDPKLAAWVAKQNAKKAADLTKARLFHLNGEVSTFDDQKLAYEVWLALPKGVRVAFRGKGDAMPVYSHSYADKP